MELIENIETLLEYYQELLGNEFYINREQIKEYEKDYFQAINKIKQLNELPENASPLDIFKLKIQNCQKCILHKGRNKFVFGEGNSNADIMFIGEAPGRDEDIQGLPFVGKAGQLLNKILASIELTREEVYITNINKCRPPNNRTPAIDEMETCFPYLEKQISIIEPKIICLLGASALKGMFRQEVSISSMRERVHNYKGIDVIVTYHPAALLRYQKFKRPTWEDMKMLRKLYDEKYLKQPFILENK